MATRFKLWMAGTLISAAALAGCDLITGKTTLPVYGSGGETIGQVNLGFSVDCVYYLGQPMAKLDFVDTASRVAFDGTTPVEVCDSPDPFYEIYGERLGVYYVRTVPNPAAAAARPTVRRRDNGVLRIELVDRGHYGPSDGDYLCLTLVTGPLAGYALPFDDDVDGDGYPDDGCAVIRRASIQMPLNSTKPVLQ